MPFRETLKGIVDAVEGGLGAVFMGYDGIAIAEYFVAESGFDLHLMAVGYTSVMKEVKRTVEVLKAGELEELSIATERATIIVRAVTDELFVFLVLARDGNAGRGRFLVRRAVSGLRQELA